jgi:hypothetical protein
MPTAVGATGGVGSCRRRSAPPRLQARPDPIRVGFRGGPTARAGATAGMPGPVGTKL